MSAWIFLVIGVFTIVGVLVTSRSPVHKLGAMIVGGIFVLAGLVRVLYGLDDIRKLDPATVTAIELLPMRDPEVYPSLVRQQRVIDGRQSIDQVMQSLARAKDWSPNHPETQWTCVLVFKTAKGQRFCDVSATANNGVLVHVRSDAEGGWQLATYRQDELGPLLEQYAGRR